MGGPFFFLGEGSAERREIAIRWETDNRFLWGRGEKEVLEEEKRRNIRILFLFRFAALACSNS